MKNCIVLSILLSLFTTARAQENTGPTHHFGISLGANYLFPFDNDLNVGVKETGFNGSVTYTLQQGKIGFQLSPFGKLHSGEDFDAMKQYYKDKGVTLNSYNSGTYLSTGMDAGLQFVLVDNGKLPVFKTYIQYGISSVRVPEINFTSESEQDGNVNVRTEGGLGLGSNLQFGVICDVFKSNNTIYNIKLGFMQETANVSVPTSTNVESQSETIRSVEMFEWRSFSAFLNLSVFFDL